jgi:hypothetical protein
MYLLGMAAMFVSAVLYGYLCPLVRRMKDVHFSIIMFYISGINVIMYALYTLV